MVISGALILSVLPEATYILVHNIALQKKNFLFSDHRLLSVPVSGLCDKTGNRENRKPSTSEKCE